MPEREIGLISKARLDTLADGDTAAARLTG
jgi:hypothetical protein